MPLVPVVIALIVVGVLLWLLNTYGTMIDAKVKQIINVLVIVCIVLWLLSLFFGFGSLNSIRVGHP